MSETRRPLRLWVLASGLLSAAIVIAALAGQTGVAKHDKLYLELERVRSLNASLRTENRRLSVETQALRSNPEYMEAVIRDELGWVRKDEMLLIFPPAKARKAADEAPPP
jgi:cell division protein FtsB